MKRYLLLGAILLTGCTSMTKPASETPTAQGHSGPPPGISYRVQNNNFDPVYQQASAYCKTYGNRVPLLEKVGKQDSGGESIAEFTCHEPPSP